MFLLKVACVDIDVLTNTAGLTLITMEVVVHEYITIDGRTGNSKKVMMINQQRMPLKFASPRAET